MKQIYLLIFIATLAVSTELHYTCDGDDWIPFENNCYKKNLKPVNWDKAQKLCKKENSNLVSIHSKKEEIFIKNNFKENCWIGLHSLPLWEWVDQKPFYNSNFEKGYPSGYGNCVAIKDNSKWVDQLCNNTFKPICRKESRKRCLSAEKKYEDGCFTFGDTKKTWKKAKQFCLSEGADLARIKNEKQSIFISNKTTNESYWIGLRRKQRWIRSDGKDAKYFVDEASLIGAGNCISKGKDKWSDRPCDQELSYICQTTGSNCSSPSLTFGNKCLHKSSEKKNWYAANKSCVESGGLLLNIQNVTEDQFISNVSSNLTMQGDIWLGYHLKREWVWTDKTQLDFKNFLDGFPSGHGSCVAMVENRWKDKPCNEELKFVCKAKLSEKCKSKKGWVRNSSFCYLFKNKPMNWYDAKTFCKNKLAHLVSLTSRKESEFIQTICRGTCWLGLHEKKYEPKWSDNSSVAYIQSQIEQERHHACFSKSNVNDQSFLLESGCLFKRRPFICKKPAKAFCPPQSLSVPFLTRVKVTFPETEPGGRASTNERCPLKGATYAIRICNSNSTWQKPNWISSCNVSIQTLKKVELTDDNVEKQAADLVVVTSKPKSSLDGAVDLVEKMLRFEKAADHNTSSLLVDVLSNVLDGNHSEIAKSRVLKTLDKIARKVDLKKESFSKISPKICVFVLQPVLEGNFSHGIKVLNFNKNHEKVFHQNQVQKLKNEPETDQFSYIFVNSKTHNENSRAIFFAFVDTSILKSKDSNLKSKINSDVILSATLTNSSLPSVVTNFKIEKLTGGNSKCVFWNDSLQIWSQYGVKTNQVTDGYIRCSANHLTNFASLFVYNKTHKSLSTLTLVGCSIALVCQVITLIFYLLSRIKQGTYQRTRGFMQCNLIFALCLVNSLLITSEIPAIKKSGSCCTNTAVLLHISLLSVFVWMLIDTLNIYIATNHPMYYRRKMSITKIQAVAIFTGWGIPIWMVVTCKVSRREMYESYTQHCWINLDWILYLVIIPISIILFINVIFFSLILRETKFKKQTKKQSNKNETPRTINFTLILFILIGGTWVCGFLITHMYNVSEKAGFVCSVVFAVLNSLQGVSLFLLYYVQRPNKQNQVSQSQERIATQKF